jgi:enamine deaminase RidA (YjgF/YER057c/UK114 family)
MEREIINPWQWQDQYGFVQANALSGAERVVLCAGQTSSDADGKPVHAGDMGAQIGQALDNLETVLGQAGLGLGDVVRLNYYTTDIQAFFGASQVLAERFQAASCRPASTLLGVAALAFPEFMIEIEATAAA